MEEKLLSPTIKHFQRLRRLLDLEAEAEKQEALALMQSRSPAEAEASGGSLIQLVVRREDAGLSGRILLTLGKRDHQRTLPWTTLRVGSPVILTEENANSPGWRGVVSALQRDAIQVAFPQWPEAKSDRPTFRLDKSSDEISRQRQRDALVRAQNAAAGSRLALLREILLEQNPPLFYDAGEIDYLDETLNDPQRAAVRVALGAEDAAIIHGPPGTGKTTTIVELIRQLARRGQTVLACAPSNLAVDNLLERLAAAGENVLRIGHPARVLPQLHEHTLDFRVETHPDVQLARKLAREAYALRGQASKYTRARPEPGARQAMRQEAKDILAEARRLEAQVVERLLDGAQILCATNTGLDAELLGRRTFDWCVMDEASQTTESAAWIPLLRADRLVLAGDPFQLPPTVISQAASAEGFNISLIERLMTHYGESIARRLSVQYRMHEAIMGFSSQEFYDNSLTADASVSLHLLHDLPGIESNELTHTPIQFIDTAGASYDESLDPDGESRFNLMEAELVAQKVEELLAAGLSPKDIAVIAPYSAQVRLLRQRLDQPEMEIDSVDGFQGREKEAVVVSLVRSNRDGEIGFLADVRRMNVALTRARRKLIVIGDSATITAHPFYARMVAYFESISAYQSVWEIGV